MSKPYLTLEKWLSTDTELKKEFLDSEKTKDPSRVKIIPLPDGNSFYFYAKIKGKFHHSEIASSNTPEHGIAINLDATDYTPLTAKVGSLNLEVERGSFDFLKTQFRSYKHQRMNKKNNRITKQIVLDQNILKKLEKITEEKNLKSLQNCLEYLINEQNFNLKAKDKEIQNLKEEHKFRKDRNIDLEQQLKRQKELTKISKENTDKATKEFENYLIKTALDAKFELEKYKTFLGELSETEVETIDDSLSDQELNKIKSQFEKDCTHKKQTLYKLHESYTNDALGFNHHEPLL